MFGRKRQPQSGARAVVPSSYPVTPTPTGPGGFTAGWAPMPGAQNPSQQIGLFAGQMLNQFPANIPGAQLHSGREWGNSGWYYPSKTYLPNGSVTQTTTPNNISGGQRYGSIFGGPIGPLSARKSAANIAAAQVRQSGVQAMEWAQSLNQ